ncbi:MAG: hypothetical protein HDS52_09940 [Barnesiella sp.]|nr:hypothetical protein [Barnesiella sp.]
MNTILSSEKLALFTGLFFIVCILVVTAILVDLWDGVHTAKKTGQRIHSHKLRVTISKISEYFRALLIGFLIDCLGFFFDIYPMPFIVILFGAGLIFTEAKSMFEHAKRRKSHTAELPQLARDIVACTKEKNTRKIIEQLTLILTRDTDDGESNEEKRINIIERTSYDN